jgi:hypothetical protein
MCVADEGIQTRARRALGSAVLFALVLRSAAGSADAGGLKALEDAFGYLEAEDRIVTTRSAPPGRAERREEARHASREDSSEGARTPRSEPRPRRD